MFFDKIGGATFETNHDAVRDMIDNTILDSDESFLYLDVKNLCTKIPLKKAINIGLKHYVARVSHLTCQEEQLNAFCS